MPADDEEAVVNQLQRQIDPLREGWTEQAVIAEVTVKEGFGLNYRVETLDGITANCVYRVTDPDREQRMYVCLDEHLENETWSDLDLTENDLFICRDTALDDTQAANFERMDEMFRTWGVPQARTVNAHYGEWGANTIPHMLARDQTYFICWRLPDELAKGVHHDWHPKPYGHFGCILDELPGHPEMYVALAVPHRPNNNLYLPDGSSFLVNRDAYKDDVDHFWRHTTFRSESPVNDIEGAAQSGARQLRIGLGSLFFGCVHTHEQRLAELSLDEFDRVMARIDELTAAYPKRSCSYDQIAEYARNRSQVSLGPVRLRGATLELRYRGHSEIPLSVYLFEDDGDGVSQEFVEIDAVDGEGRISV